MSHTDPPPNNYGRGISPFTAFDRAVWAAHLEQEDARMALLAIVGLGNYHKIVPEVERRAAWFADRGDPKAMTKALESVTADVVSGRFMP